MDHGSPEMPMCSMSMLFNWNIKDVCIVFEWWHIHSLSQFILSSLALVAIAVFYEFLRAQANCLDQKKTCGAGSSMDETVGLLSSKKRHSFARSGLYAVLVGLSFWIMLVFMTYNGYLMLAIIAGAGIGHYLFNDNLSSDRSIQCH
ncbi:Ctr copper transporter [Phycomyces nitens]|nr:Ctr copper transporter [Phycomyces nitens]